jgi:hypothetical protein
LGLDVSLSYLFQGDAFFLVYSLPKNSKKVYITTAN